MTAVILLSPGCHRVFSCDDDTQCRLDGVAGACEPEGWCSFPADDCPSGRRWGEHAARDLAGACIDDVPSDTSAVAETSSSTTIAPSTSSESSTTAPVDDDPCNGLTPSGPIVVDADDAVIAGVLVTADAGDGIVVDGFSGVTIRDSEIHHRDGRGIAFRNADRITIENVVIVHDGAPEQGPHVDGDQANIDGADSDTVRIDRVRVSRGSSGILLAATPAAHVSFVEAHDVRGPGLAACVRLFDSDDAILEDFSCENPLDTGRPADLVALAESSNGTVRRGLLDGHNSQFGYGIHFVQINGQHSGGLVEDVDGVRMTNGAFSCFSYGENITFRRTRARDNICEIVSIPIDDCDKPGPNGGCIPGSNGVSWTASEGSMGIAIEDSAYFALCTDPTWPEGVFMPAELVEEDFVPRDPIRIETCWGG